MSANPYQVALDSLNRELVAAKQAVDEANKVAIEKSRARDSIKAAIASIEALVPKSARTAKYWFSSRTSSSRPGHYVEKFADGTVKCSCEGFNYNKTCWAVAKVKTTSDWILKPYVFGLGDRVFDQRRDAAATVR